jgi:CHAT domain-containing protein
MRTSGVFLCLLLLTVAGGRPYKLKQTRLISNAETPVRAALGKKWANAVGLRKLGEYARAAALFQAGYDNAARLKDADYETRFLVGLGQTHLVQHRYSEALQEYVEARKVMPSSNNTLSLTTLDGSLSSLYSQLGEYDAAIQAANRALAEAPRDARGDMARATLFGLLANIAAKQGRPDAALEFFQKGIREAARFDNPELLSNAWDRLGAELLLQMQLPRAEDALLEAYRIRKLNKLPSLGWSYRHLGMLRLAQGDLGTSSRLLDIALAESKQPRGRMPQWQVYQSRGALRLAEGKTRGAYADFRLALELARNFRLAVPPADATRVSLAQALQGLYSSFVETGSHLYFETGSAELAAETFEAVEENRAAALAARLKERKLRWRNLPPAYWDLLGQLEAAESAALRDDSEGPRARMRHIRASLIELEAETGGAASSGDGNLLDRVRRSLGPGAVLLSFHLARPASSLWAVSESGLSLYQLPDGSRIAAEAGEFRQAVLAGNPESEGLGRKLYRTLFGGLGPEYRDRSRWLLSLDEGLFNVPFAALVAGGEPASPEYLIERHSIRTISGAAMLAGGGSPFFQSAGSFVGVGDAIYNTADARWGGRLPEHTWPRFSWAWLSFGASAAAPETLGLSRLPGSGPEVESCAREWGGGSVLLEGRDATKANVRRALASKPAVVHFATHVVAGAKRGSSTLIALSVSDNGREELLSPDEVGGWSADAGLVVLSGCASGSASARPGEGSMGLTRAWLMAGSRAVVATDWPTTDDSGVFFRRFYARLRRSSGRDPAEALRAAQIETRRTGGWRSQPGFWAAYFALGNY